CSRPRCSVRSAESASTQRSETSSGAIAPANVTHCRAVASEPPPRAGVLRTPESCFADIVDYPWPPSFIELEPGLRMAYVDTGARSARETLVLLHGEPTWGYLYRKMIGPLEAAGFRVIVP